MSEPYSNVPNGKFSVTDTELVTQVKMLEQTPTLSWESSDANRATRQAALAVGEGADIATFLIARARIAKKMIEAKNPSIKASTVKLVPPAWLTWGLFAIALLAGLLTDQFASTGSRINLLSLPFFGILLWNIVVYLALFISGFREDKRRDFLGIRQSFSFLQKNILTKSLDKAKTLGQLMAPFLTEFTARAFHLAALGFVVGMIVSVLLRGIGTAYTVGWESTWLAESPEIVYQLIMVTYGFFTNFLGPMPNILEVANLRFDRLAMSGVEVSASLWLLRIIVMLCFFVVIPRLLLVFKHTIAISKLTKNYPLDLEDRYYQDILKAWRAEELNLDLMIPDTNSNQSAIETAYRLAESLGFNLAEVRNHTLDFASEEAPLTLEASGTAQQVWILMNGTTTPEHEVQGHTVELIKAKVGKAKVLLLVDMGGYITRFGDFADRIQMRQDLWKDFAESVKVPVVFYHSGLKPDQQTQAELKKACGQVA